MAAKRLPGIDLPRVIEIQRIPDGPVRDAMLAIEQNLRELLRDSNSKLVSLKATVAIAEAAQEAAEVATEAVESMELVVDTLEASIADLEARMTAAESDIDLLQALVATLGDLAFLDTLNLSSSYATGVAPLARGGTGHNVVAAGDLLVGGGGAWTRLALGLPGQVATVNPAGDDVEWADPESGGSEVFAQFPFFDGLGFAAEAPMPAGTLPFYRGDGSVTFYHAFSGLLAFLDGAGDPVLHYGLIPGGGPRLTLEVMD